MGLKQLHFARSGGPSRWLNQTVEGADFRWPQPRTFTWPRAPVAVKAPDQEPGEAISGLKPGTGRDRRVGGRLILGFGAGTFDHEFDAIGLGGKDRVCLLSEALTGSEHPADDALTNNFVGHVADTPIAECDARHNRVESRAGVRRTDDLDWEG